jgi:hypothetical protein
VAIHARTVVVDVRSVDDGLVFFGLKVSGLGGLHLDLPEASRDVRGVVSRQPSSPFTKPQEPEYLALTLGSGKDSRFQPARHSLKVLRTNSDRKRIPLPTQKRSNADSNTMCFLYTVASEFRGHGHPP